MNQAYSGLHWGNSPIVTNQRNVREEFRRIIDRDLTPVLLRQGFIGKRPHWRRLREPFVDCVNLQSSKYGDECCLNLGVHLTFLPIYATDEIFKWTKLREDLCFFRCRLTDAPHWNSIWDLGDGDQWWGYEEPENSAAELISCFANESAKFYALFSMFPESLLSDTSAYVDLNPTRCFLMAHIHVQLGNWQEAKKYSTLGIRRFALAETFGSLLTTVERAEQKALNSVSMRVAEPIPNCETGEG